jgi:hypothetical protein
MRLSIKSKELQVYDNYVVMCAEKFVKVESGIQVAQGFNKRGRLSLRHGTVISKESQLEHKGILRYMRGGQIHKELRGSAAVETDLEDLEIRLQGKDTTDESENSKLGLGSSCLSVNSLHATKRETLSKFTLTMDRRDQYEAFGIETATASKAVVQPSLRTRTPPMNVARKNRSSMLANVVGFNSR